MRPLRLDIAGFAAFRDPVTVDFTDADYFALTGPTGSGKSTVIDAMTFALYGSAPRWGRDNAVQYALAPTANRCTVRLVFDVAGDRYVVAREVRRSGRTIGQRNSRLERFLDPQATGNPETDEPVESLAADPRAVRQQVIALLGLDFDDFCTCVVLPQGDFATFLQASVAERQAILLKLLGARHYEAIGRMANRRAADANARIDALQGQLAGYADATEQAEAGAHRRETTLVELTFRARDEVDALTEILRTREEIAAQVSQLTAALGVLDGVAAPPDIAALQRSLADADHAYEVAARAERTADEASADAEHALADGPRREPLEETLRCHAEHAQVAALLPDSAAAAEAAAAALVLAQRAADTADAELTRARADHDQHRLAVQQCAQLLTEIDRRLDALQGIAVPPGTDDLDRAAAASRTAADQAAAELATAELAVADAVAVIAELPERSAIEAIQRTVADCATAAELVVAAHQQEAVLSQDALAAEQQAARAARRLESARANLESLTVTSAAAGLRSHLAVGHACPVCDQSVAELPQPLHEPALDKAHAELAAAEDEGRAASMAANRLHARLTGATTEHQAYAARLAALDRRLEQELPDRPGGVERDLVHDRGAVELLLSRLEEALAVQQSALRTRETARAASQAAEQETIRIADTTRRGWETLHTTHGRLEALGAPILSAGGLAESWTTLVNWCRSQTDETAKDRASAQVAAQAAADELTAATGRLGLTTGAAQTAVEQRQAAAVAAGAAQAEHATLQRRLTELDAALTARPAESTARELLAVHVRLDAAAREARARAHTAGQTRQRAETERDRWRTARNTARAALQQTREPIVPLGAPVLDDSDLGAAWAELVVWATAESTAQRAQLEARSTELVRVDDDIAGRLVALAGQLVTHELPAPSLSVEAVIAPQGTARLQRIATDVEVAVERARATTSMITRRREEAEALRTKIANETDTEQVARQLGQMMSAKRFPQWLADAALDTLVAGASASLLELSGRQFELTHEKGEFFVVDHADADSLRSVKTLSGGETFQASLALALALSEQLSTLAAGGRTTLDSIFLDEGFGTLDPDALEIVASTLEHLAQGRRMVGVVTHVPALAERVPVRFEVSRGSRTSLIERVGT